MLMTANMRYAIFAAFAILAPFSLSAQDYQLHQDAMEAIFEYSETLDGEEKPDGTLPMLSEKDARSLKFLLDDVRRSKHLYEEDAELPKLEQSILSLIEKQEERWQHNKRLEQKTTPTRDPELVQMELGMYLYGNLVAKACLDAGVGFNDNDIEVIEDFLRNSIREQNVPANIADRAWNNAKAQYAQVASSLTDRDCAKVKSIFALPLIQAQQKAMNDAEANGTLEANPFR